MAPKVRSCLSMISACFFDVPVRYFVGTSKNTWEISHKSRFLMCFGSFRTDVPGSWRILATPLFHVFWFRAEPSRPPACQFRGFSQKRGRRSSCGFPTVKCPRPRRGIRAWKKHPSDFSDRCFNQIYLFFGPVFDFQIFNPKELSGIICYKD